MCIRRSRRINELNVSLYLHVHATRQSAWATQCCASQPIGFERTAQFHSSRVKSGKQIYTFLSMSPGMSLDMQTRKTRTRDDRGCLPMLIHMTAFSVECASGSRSNEMTRSAAKLVQHKDTWNCTESHAWGCGTSGWDVFWLFWDLLCYLSLRRESS